ncbi:MAG: hypothetical protein K1X90_14245 [Candidatus Kapabacteria bacterium]|nr:hypothetical protein [Candidatus Kapabacteria bacterium]
MTPSPSRLHGRLFLLLLPLLLGFWGCTQTAPNGPLANRPPVTHLATDTVNNVLTSRVHLNWYGDDPDGFVRGFLFSWDRANWYFTRRNDSTFSLPLQGANGLFTFSIAAVDNGAAVFPQADTAITVPFDDANSNGRYDDGEKFVGLEGATDPTPATLDVPIENSPPVVFFGDDSTQASRRLVQLPDTTFTVATFRWVGYDIDGAGTIARYEWALNDTVASGAWHPLPPGTTTITLHELDGIRPNDLNRFYLRAVDAAGANSKTIAMPENDGVWYAKRPRGRLLLVRDYTFSDAAGFYAGLLDTLDGGRLAGKYDEFDIRRGAASTGGYGALVPPIIDPMVIETFRLFDAIIWYGDASPTLALAAQTLPAYTRSGGKVLMTTALPSVLDAQAFITDFAPVDSVATNELPNPLPATTTLGPVPLPEGGEYPPLQKGSGTMFVHPLYPAITASVLYRLPLSSAWQGEPVVAVRSGEKRFILASVQLHKLTQASVGEFLRRVLVVEFGL